MSQQKLFRVTDIKEHVRPFGFQLVLDRISAAGHCVRPLRPSDTSGTILMSLYWMEDIYELIRWRRRNGINARFNLIVGGNHASCYPNSLLSFADAAYLGDGELWDGDEDAAAVVKIGAKSPRQASVSADIQESIIRLESKSTRTGKTVNIVELTRGCNKKCYFCQYAWSKPFRVANTEFVVDCIRSISANTIRLVTADLHMHPQHGRILSECSAAGVRNVSQDGSLLEIRKNIQLVATIAATQRFGIDGMSERLRRNMNKPIGTNELIELVIEMYKRGARRFLAYNLFGVPGETREDFDEYNDALRRIADRMPGPCTFVTCWNAFLPTSLTPMQWEQSSWNNDKRDHAGLLMTTEHGEKRGVKLYHMPMKTGNRRITLRMLAMRSSPKTADLVYSVAINPRISERQILDEFEKAEGYHLHSQRPIDEALPWDEYLRYDRVTLQRIARYYRGSHDAPRRERRNDGAVTRARLRL